MRDYHAGRADIVRCMLAAGLLLGMNFTGQSADRTDRPNIVIVFADDLGYADIGCFGGKIPTPHIDRLAREGVKFTDFYVAQAVCSASRTALLTGCYPNRVGILGALNPKSTHGIADRETTIAEVLKPRGYATACIGKWHLGHHPKFLPTRHGFDEYYGLPYSNDMWPKHPSAMFPPLPLIDGDKTTIENPDQSHLTRDYTRRAVKFMKEHKDEPFFVYLAHSMPHVPIFASESFLGKTGQGLFADVVSEVDWSVGEILKTAAELGVDEKTLVIFTSDNGPWLNYGDHAGSAAPLREGKGTAWEGGVREPFAARWPGTLPAGRVVSEPAMTIDLLPTIAALTGGELPTLPIDGRDIRDLLLAKPGAKSPQEAYFFWYGSELWAVRAGPWKLYFPHTYRTMGDNPPGKGGSPGRYQQARCGLELYNLASDISETKDVAAQHPDVVARLKALADRAREALGDSATKIKGKEVRPAGQL